MRDLTGQTIDHYQIIQRLGAGAMGVVYHARDLTLDRDVALKFVSDAIAADEMTLARFRREARAAAQLEHPNIVTIYEVNLEANPPYLAMQFVQGRELSNIIIEQAPMSLPVAISITRQIAEGMHRAHTHGVVHRDIKPANIMICPDGQAVIMDFGIASFEGSRSGKLTATGAVVGTPAYMAPEQCRGAELDHRTDIHALGVIFYQTLTGRLPYEADDPFGIMYKIVHEPPPSALLFNKDLPAMVDAVLGKALAKEPAGRYPSCKEFIVDMDALLHDFREATRALRPDFRADITPLPPGIHPPPPITPMPTTSPYRQGTMPLPAEPVTRSHAVITPVPEAEEDYSMVNLRRGIAMFRGTEGKVALDRAQKLFRMASEADNPIAQMWLGYLFHKGYCALTTNTELGARMIQKALPRVEKMARAEHAEALFLMGAAHEIGVGVIENKAEAARLYRKAGDKGHCMALYNLANLYSKGEGVAQNDTEAFNWFKRSAEGGDAAAACRLGLCYLNGVGVASDLNQAFRWYKESAEKGYPLAQTNVGLLYMNGYGVAKSESEAARWWEKAAREDHVAAYNLAVLYSKGMGVPVDERRAIELWRDAARVGNPKAQAALKSRGERWE